MKHTIFILMILILVGSCFSLNYYVAPKGNNTPITIINITNMINNTNYIYIYKNITNNITNVINNDNTITINNNQTIIMENNITNSINITNINVINVSDPIFIKQMGYNLTSELETLFYSILNPQKFINDSVEVMSFFYNKTDINFLLSYYLTKSDFDIENISIWKNINSIANSSNISLNIETQSRIGNDSYLNNYIVGVNTTSNIENLGFYNKSYLDPFLVMGGARIYWFTNTTNGITKNMTLTLPTNSMVTLKIPISNSKISLGAFITPKMTSTTIFASGMRNIYITTYNGDTNREVELQAIVTRCINYNEITDSCDSQVGFAQSTTTLCTETTADVHRLTYYVNSTYLLNISDRFIVNITALKISGGNTDFNLEIDDNSFSRIEVPSPVGVTDISGKLDKTDQRYNDTLMILSVNNSLNYEIQSRIDNNTQLQNLINTLNLSFVNNVSSFSNNVSSIQNQLNNLNKSTNDNFTFVNNNINSLNTTLINLINTTNSNTIISFLANDSIIISNLNNLSKSVLDNSTLLKNEIISRINNDTYYNLTLMNYINVINSSAWNELNDKASLTKENVFLNNVFFMANVTLLNGFLANASVGLLTQIGTTLYFNVTLGTMYVRDSITTNNFYGNLNASYIQNPYWSTTTQLNNLINSLNINSSILNSNIMNETQSRIGNDSLLSTSIINNNTQLQNNINILNQSFINNVSEINNNLTKAYKYYSNIGNWSFDKQYYFNVSTDLINDTYYINLSTNAMLNNISFYNTSLINTIKSVNSTSNIMSLGFNNATYDLFIDSNLTYTYLNNKSNANFNNVTINNLFINSTSSYMYFDSSTNTTYLRYLNGNFSFWDNSDPMLVLDQNDNVIAKHNLMVDENLTTKGNLFVREQDISYDNTFLSHSQFPNSPLTISGNVNSYLQVVLQNRNNSNLSSMDLIIGSSTMTDTFNYSNYGYNSNTYNDVLFSATDKNAGYIINIATGNYSIVSNTGIKFTTGGTTSDKTRMIIDTQPKITINANVTIQNSTGGSSASLLKIGKTMICSNSTNWTIITSRNGVSCN